MLVPAPAEREPPPEEGCAADAGVRRTDGPWLDGLPDAELPPVPWRKDCAAAAGVVFLLRPGGRPPACLLRRPLPLPPDVCCARVVLLSRPRIPPPIIGGPAVPVPASGLVSASISIDSTASPALVLLLPPLPSLRCCYRRRH